MLRERLKLLRKREGLTQEELAAIIGVERSTVGKYEGNQGVTPSAGILQAIADYFHVTTDYLLGRTDDPTDYEDGDLIASISPALLDHFGGDVRKALAAQEAAHREAGRSRGVPIPILGRVPAGIPIEAVQDILDYEEISHEMASLGEYFALQIRGDSMSPRIREGDVVIVRKQNAVENGDIAVILVNGEDATVKRFFQSEQGIKLLSSNPAYEPLFYTASEVKSLPVVVIGKVVELRGKL